MEKTAMQSLLRMILCYKKVNAQSSLASVRRRRRSQHIKHVVSNGKIYGIPGLLCEGSDGQVNNCKRGVPDDSGIAS